MFVTDFPLKVIILMPHWTGHVWDTATLSLGIKLGIEAVKKCPPLRYRAWCPSLAVFAAAAAAELPLNHPP